MKFIISKAKIFLFTSKTFHLKFHLVKGFGKGPLRRLSKTKKITSSLTLVHQHTSVCFFKRFQFAMHSGTSVSPHCFLSFFLFILSFCFLSICIYLSKSRDYKEVQVQ